MIKTAITLSLAPDEARTVTYLVNGTQLGMLSSGTQNNHIQTSNRQLQSILAVRSEPPESGSLIAYQRQRVSVWQGFLRIVARRGVRELNTLLTQYRLEPDLLICFDDSRMSAWLPAGSTFYLLRQDELRPLRPINPRDEVVSRRFMETRDYYSLQVSEDDYYLLVRPEMLEFYGEGEAAGLMLGLRQLPAKMSDLVQTARLRGYEGEDTMLAIQLLRIEEDQHQEGDRQRRNPLFRSWFAKSVSSEDSAEQEPPPQQPARGSSASREVLRRSADSDTDEDDDIRLRRIFASGSLWPPDRRNRPFWLVLSGMLVLLMIVLFLTRLRAGSREPADTTRDTGFWPSSSTQTTVTSWTEPVVGTSSQPTTTTTTTTVATTTTTTKPTVFYKVNVNSLNLRDKPGVSGSKILATLQNGDKLVLVEAPKDGWVKVTVSKSGTVGYVSARYIVLDQPASSTVK